MTPPRQQQQQQGPRPSGALERSLARLTIGASQSQRDRLASATRTGEFWQQVRVGVTGKATPDWTFAQKQVSWQLPFLCAPQQRAADFRPDPSDIDGVPQTDGSPGSGDDARYVQKLLWAGAPHFAYGVEMFPPFPPKPAHKTDPLNVVIVVAQVAQWSLDSHYWVVGATVQYGCLAPTAANLDAGVIPFRAIVHMSFQGYGAVPETSGAQGQ